MNKGVSLYLDVARFSAAMVVFLGHASGQLFTGGLFWQLGDYMRVAVIVFFVLSGYVIAHVLQDRESTVREYATARISRLYSIAIPALLLTAICDFIGLRIDPALYYEGPWGYPEGNQAWNYLASFFFVNRFWDLRLDPGINVPFWSLSFEAVYYVAAALLVFAKGAWRIVLPLLLFVIAGPTITLLAPLWFLGYGIFYFNQRIATPAWISAALAIAGLALLILVPTFFEERVDTMTQSNLAGDYVAAIAFAIHLVGIYGLSKPLELALGWCSGFVRWAGSMTFALYLFHRPLIQLFTAADIADPSSWLQRLYLLSATFLIVATVGWWCEKQKSTIRRALNSVRLEGIFATGRKI